MYKCRLLTEIRTMWQVGVETGSVPTPPPKESHLSGCDALHEELAKPFFKTRASALEYTANRATETTP